MLPVANALGRPVIGYLSDKLGRRLGILLINIGMLTGVLLLLAGLYVEIPLYTVLSVIIVGIMGRNPLCLHGVRRGSLRPKIFGIEYFNSLHWQSRLGVTGEPYLFVNLLLQCEPKFGIHCVCRDYLVIDYPNCWINSVNA